MQGWVQRPCKGCTPMSEHLDRLFAKLCRKPGTEAALMSVDAPGHGLYWRGHAPDVAPGSAFALASGTKLFTTALVLQAVDAGRISLDDTAATHLPHGTLKGLHVIDGEDHGDRITLRQCLANSTGLACYFEDRPRGGRSILDRLRDGEDFGWTDQDALDRVRRELPAKFAPGTPGRAHYSDTNYLIAGMVLEAIARESFGDQLDAGICRPLGMERTWVLTGNGQDGQAEILPIRNNRRIIPFHKTLAANGCQGAVVSTLDDSQRFLKGFFGGTLFDKTHLVHMQQDWRRIFNPFLYGTGLQRFQIPRIFTPFRPVPPLIGHSGVSGVVMYHCPERDVTFTGSTNQIGSRGLPYRFMMRALRAIGTS